MIHCYLEELLKVTPNLLTSLYNSSEQSRLSEYTHVTGDLYNQNGHHYLYMGYNNMTKVSLIPNANISLPILIDHPSIRKRLSTIENVIVYKHFNHTLESFPKEKSVLKVLYSLVFAVNELHKTKQYHLNIKPSTVAINLEGSIKVTLLDIQNHKPSDNVASSDMYDIGLCFLFSLVKKENYNIPWKEEHLEVTEYLRPLVHGLLRKLLGYQPERPTAATVLRHPIFWKQKRCIEYIKKNTAEPTILNLCKQPKELFKNYPRILATLRGDTSKIGKYFIDYTIDSICINEKYSLNRGFFFNNRKRMISIVVLHQKDYSCKDCGNYTHNKCVVSLEKLFCVSKGPDHYTVYNYFQCTLRMYVEGDTFNSTKLVDIFKSLMKVMSVMNSSYILHSAMPMLSPDNIVIDDTKLKLKGRFWDANISSLADSAHNTADPFSLSDDLPVKRFVRCMVFAYTKSNEKALNCFKVKFCYPELDNGPQSFLRQLDDTICIDKLKQFDYFCSNQENLVKKALREKKQNNH